MRDYKYWVNGYNEELGEFSLGFNDITKALYYYKKKMEEINKDGGEIELLEVSVRQFYNN